MTENKPNDQLFRAIAFSDQQPKIEARNPKFQELYEKQTNGINFDLTTDDIVQCLEQWDALYSIEISEVENDGLALRLPRCPMI